MQNTISSARERRRFPRLPIEFDVRFRVVDAATSTREESVGRTLDLARGAFVSAPIRRSTRATCSRST